jgi:hypothetical protein
MAESVLVRQQQMAAELEQIRIQIADLTSKVNGESIRSEPQPVMPLPGAEKPATHGAVPSDDPASADLVPLVNELMRVHDDPFTLGRLTLALENLQDAKTTKETGRP